MVHERLPPAYLAPPYVIVDWQERHPLPPPPGYRWVRVGNDIVLAAVATGLIAEVIKDAFD